MTAHRVSGGRRRTRRAQRQRPDARNAACFPDGSLTRVTSACGVRDPRSARGARRRPRGGARRRQAARGAGGAGAARQPAGERGTPRPRAVGRGRAAERGQDGAGLRRAAAQGARRPRRAGHHAGRLPPARGARASSTPSASSARSPPGATRWRPVARRRRPRSCARRWSCGAVRRSPSSPSMPFVPAEIARLEEQHLAALELRVEADLAAGRHAELVAELAAAHGEHPWRERLHAQLMLALYRSGRQADALEAYRRAREVLVERARHRAGAGAARAPAGDPRPGSRARRAGRASRRPAAIAARAADGADRARAGPGAHRRAALLSAAPGC